MITSYRGNGFLRSSGREYFICHDCGSLIEIVPGVVPADEGYPIVLEMDNVKRVAKRVKYRCKACRANSPSREDAPCFSRSTLAHAESSAYVQY
jgi:transposase-like protein